MKPNCGLRLPAAACAVLILFGTAASSIQAEDGWGNLKGQILFDGAVPKLELLHEKNAPVKNAAICAARDQYKNDLLVDKKTKGIADVVIYIHMKDARNVRVHPELKASKKEKVTFDQKGCRFIPHVLIVRTDQKVELKSQDGCAHNVKTNMIFNQAQNILLPPNAEGVELQMTKPEILPMPVECNIHPWMKAHWLVVDHPYAAITDKQGKFEIKNLPAGEVKFTVWHERPGFYEGKPSALAVTIPSDGTLELDPIKWAASEFDK